MNSLPDPHRSAAVIIGVSRYEHEPPLPAVANNRDRLKAALTDPGIWGLPEKRCLVVPDPADSAELIYPVIEAAQQAKDTLFVYYAGHGFPNKNGELFLTVPGSRDGRPFTAMPYDWLRQAILENSRAQRRILVLDCCYSGRALETMSAAAASLPAAASIDGAYLLTAVAETVQALALKQEDYTAFTGELIRVLSEGVRDGTEFLTLDVVYEQVLHSLRAKGRPQPQVQDRGQIGRLPFVRNRGQGAETPSEPRRKRGCLIAAAAGVLLAATAVPVTWKLATWDDRRSSSCSPDASLLGFSDKLDKVRYKGRRLSGLSSLALDGPSRLLTLSDKAPPSLYRLSVNPQEEPDPRIDGTTVLQRKDGSAYSGSDDFDGEAMALEKGGRTVLVASESGPSISRFDLKSGRLVTGFEVPERFRIAPEGGAQKNQSFESMALSPSGEFLYVGIESPLSGDGSHQGRSLVRILRYKGTPGGSYSPDRQFAYRTGSGLRLAELVASEDEERLLAVERGYSEGQGNVVHVHRISLRDRPDVSQEQSLVDVPSGAFASKRQLFDLADCPASGARSPQKQPNPLMENVEGAALGPELTEGEHKGRRVLYLVSDDNARSQQVTRFYTLAVTTG